MTTADVRRGAMEFWFGVVVGTVVGAVALVVVLAVATVKSGLPPAW